MGLDVVNQLARRLCKNPVKYYRSGGVPFASMGQIDFELYVLAKDAGIIRALNSAGKRAITLGEVVIVREGELSPALIRHEAVHVTQWRRGGFKFALRYLLNPKKFEAPAEVAEAGDDGGKA